MNSLSSTKNISKRTLTFNKSFLISVLIHAFLIFGLSITTYYKLPIFKESPIINVKFANSSQDFLTNSNIGNMENLEKELSSSVEGNMSSSRNISQSFKIKKLQANSIVNSEEAVYLNLWQRQIETIGDNLISESKNIFDGTVQIMACLLYTSPSPRD